MGYIKGGIVTRIDIMTQNKKTKEYLENYFDLSLYKKEKNTYLIDETNINKNIKEFRKELLTLTNNKGDSIENSEAYLLETTANNLLSKRVILKEHNKKYSFEKYKDINFETDMYEIKKEKVCIILSILILIWDTNKIEIEEPKFFNDFINNLVRKSTVNTLKNSSWFTIIN